MSKEVNVRWSWLKAMYICTIVGAGGFENGLEISAETIVEAKSGGESWNLKQRS